MSVLELPLFLMAQVLITSASPVVCNGRALLSASPGSDRDYMATSYHCRSETKDRHISFPIYSWKLGHIC